MKIKNLLKSAVNLAVATTATLSMQYPAKADYDPQRNVPLTNFKTVLSKVGFAYGGYSRFPYCFNTLETLDGTVPVVIVCPMKSGDRNSNYAVSSRETVSAIWISMLVDRSASQTLTKRALSKAGLVAKVFADARFNVTQSSVGDVLGREVYRVMNGEGASYVSSSGSSCNKRIRNLNNVGIFETTACFKSRGQAQITIWF